MTLELLPNELFLDLFGYINCIDLLHAFYNLNSRFNFLLYKQVRFYYFKFQSVSKSNFDMICQQHLPFIADRVIVLCLHNSNETPEQINLFFSYIPSFNQFTQLRSLKLFNVHSYETLSKLLDQCHHLNNLTHLNFYCYCYENDKDKFQSIVNSVWNLPKLTYCYFGIVIKEQHHFCLPTIISLSLEYVTIRPCELEMNQINQLFEYTPRLKYLSTFIVDLRNDIYIGFLLPTLIQLKICFFCSSHISKAVIFLQNIPNLRHLDIKIWCELIDGYQWEEIIRNYLPKLKTFALQMRNRLSSDQNIQERADRLIDSFRTSFWIKEHQWFVRLLTQYRTIYLHTLSSVSNCHEVMCPDSWRSTYAQDNQQEFYDHRTSIYEDRFFDQPISSHIRLPNIEDLHIKLPINNQFWSICPNLNKLRSLTISSDVDTYQPQLQTLLDQAIHLEEVVIKQIALSPIETSILKYTNKSIRRFDLINCINCFNEEECVTLTRSPLGIQCEVLSICVNNRPSIIYLIKNMRNLRALIVKCTNKNNDDDFCLAKELIPWLKVRLSSTCLITNVRDDVRRVSIWI